MGFSPKIKERLFVACHRHCCICHKSAGSKMEVHHIIPRYDGGPDTEENGIPLCLDCHVEVGAYNPKHRKGNKFSPSELRKHKEQWFEICRDRFPLNSNETDEYTAVGIRSFERGAENMPNETEKMLCMIDFFNGREIKEGYSWDNDIFCALNEFTKELESENEYRLHLDTHISIAFVAGYLLDSKRGIEIYPMQKTAKGKKDWGPVENSDENYGKWEDEIITLSNDGKDVALVLGVTHDILDEVKEYIENKQTEISKVISCKIDGHTGYNTIVDGTHAKELANSLSTILKENRNIEEKNSNLHIFVACPVAFMFYLGQVSRSFGKVNLYEHDFEGQRSERYLLSFELPISDENE